MITEIDSFEFTRRQDSCEDTTPIRDFARLTSLLADAAGDLTWRFDGWRERGNDGRDELLVRLRLSGSVSMRCGRCLGIAPIPLAVDRRFLLADSEDEAARLDEADEERDVLVSSRRFQLAELIEDEAILALPPAASHARCDPPLAGARADEDSSDETVRPNPFDALRGLKTGRSS